METGSYLDTGNKRAFGNAPVPALRPRLVLDPTTDRWAIDAAAQLVEAQDRVKPIWQRLAERAAGLCYCTSHT